MNSALISSLEEMLKLYQSAVQANDQFRALNLTRALAFLKAVPFRIESSVQLETYIKTLPPSRRRRTGLGKSTLEKIDDILRTGTTTTIEFRKNDPKARAFQQFLQIWGVGHATAQMLYDHGFRSIQDLKDFVSRNNSSPKYRTSSGQSPILTQSSLLCLSLHDDLTARIPYTEATDIYALVRRAVQLCYGSGVRAYCCGSYRRGKATCGDIDILLTTDECVPPKKDIDLARLLAVLHRLKFLVHDLQNPYTSRRKYEKNTVDGNANKTKYMETGYISPEKVRKQKRRRYGRWEKKDRDDTDCESEELHGSDADSDDTDGGSGGGHGDNSPGFLGCRFYSSQESIPSILHPATPTRNVNDTSRIERDTSASGTQDTPPRDRPMTVQPGLVRNPIPPENTCYFPFPTRYFSDRVVSYMGICRLPAPMQKTPPSSSSSATGANALDSPPSVHRRIDIRYYPREALPFALLYFTGSASFNRGIRHYLNGYGWALSDVGLVRTSIHPTQPVLPVQSVGSVDNKALQMKQIEQRSSGIGREEQRTLSQDSVNEDRGIHVDHKMEGTQTKGYSVWCDTEEDVFRVCGLAYKPPSERETFTECLYEPTGEESTPGGMSPAGGIDHKDVDTSALPDERLLSFGETSEISTASSSTVSSDQEDALNIVVVEADGGIVFHSDHSTDKSMSGSDENVMMWKDWHVHNETPVMAHCRSGLATTPNVDVAVEVQLDDTQNDSEKRSSHINDQTMMYIPPKIGDLASFDQDVPTTSNALQGLEQSSDNVVRTDSDNTSSDDEEFVLNFG